MGIDWGGVATLMPAFLAGSALVGVIGFAAWQWWTWRHFPTAHDLWHAEVELRHERASQASEAEVIPLVHHVGDRQAGAIRLR